jgi:hypothetical protein
LRRTKDYEKVITLGMRGDGDEPMSESESIALLERIVADQRKIIGEIINPNIDQVPQVWALYKEVQGYYERGMRVPDDVTLLWCDDNWGNIRRLPTAEERKRSGRRGNLLSLRLRRRAAELQMDQHRAAAKNLGADESRLALRRDESLDRERRRHQAAGSSAGIFPVARVESRRVAEG